MAFQSKIADLSRRQEIIAVFTVAGFGDFFSISSRGSRSRCAEPSARGWASS
jgi:hypothetical protein